MIIKTTTYKLKNKIFQEEFGLCDVYYERDETSDAWDFSTKGRFEIAKYKGRKITDDTVKLSGNLSKEIGFEEVDIDEV